MIKYTSSHYTFPKKITWDDVMEKISNEYESKSYLIISKRNVSFPSFVLHNNFFPKSILKSFNEVKNDCNIKILHTYISFCKESDTFGRHCDEVDVLIVQAIGSVSYEFDSGECYTLYPGDSLFIPKGVYHNPIVNTPRVTLSFSWE